MNNNNWITDRKPEFKDAPYEKVWVMLKGRVYLTHYTNTILADAWQPVISPEPYVKPKRWTVEWDGDYNIWILADSVTPSKGSLLMLHRNDDECRIIAERIAEIYNEMMP